MEGSQRMVLLSLFVVSTLGLNCGASDFDAYLDPCLKDSQTLPPLTEGVLKQENFLPVKDPVSGQTNWVLNCDKRRFSIQALRDGQSQTAVLKPAIQTLGYQSTFSSEAAMALLNFIDAQKSMRSSGFPAENSVYYFAESLTASEQAAQAFYLLHDHHADHGAFLKFYIDEKVKESLQYYFSQEENFVVAALVTQVPQKVGNTYLLSNLHDSDMMVGEQLAEIFVPMLVKAGEVRAKNKNAKNLELISSIQNEILVAMENLRYAKITKSSAIKEDLAKWLAVETDEGTADHLRELMDLLK